MSTGRGAWFGIVGGGVFFGIIHVANMFFPLYAIELGASLGTIGVMVMLKGFLPIFIAMPVGQLIDIVGSMRMLGYGAALMLASLACMILADGVGLLVLSQVLIGASIVITASSFQVLVARGEREARNTAIKRYSLWMSGGAMLGPLIGGAISSGFDTLAEGYRMTFVSAAGLTMVFMLVIAVFGRRVQTPPPLRLDAGPDDRARGVFSVRGVSSSYRSGFTLAALPPVRFGLAATFLMVFVQTIYMSFLPIFLVQNGYGTMLVSAVVSAQAFAGMASRYAMGMLMRRLSLQVILLAAGLIGAIGILATPLAVQHPAMMFANAVMLGAAVGVNLPAGIMIMVDSVGEDRRGKLMGLRLLANRVAQVLSPGSFGLAASFLGLTWAFAGGGAFLVALALGFQFVNRRNRR